MRPLRTETLLLVAMTLATACTADGTRDQDVSDADMGEAQAMEQSVEAPQCYVARGSVEEALARPSPLRQTEIGFEGGRGLLCYGAPSARSREIMGGLLVYGQPERLGANEATALHLTAPTRIGGVSVAPGSYSIYVIANQDQWEFFLSSDWQRWGVPITEDIRAREVGSFTATPQEIDEMVETLTFRWEANDGDTMGSVVVEWEHTQVRFEIGPGGI